MCPFNRQKQIESSNKEGDKEGDKEGQESDEKGRQLLAEIMLQRIDKKLEQLPRTFKVTQRKVYKVLFQMFTTSSTL